MPQHCTKTGRQLRNVKSRITLSLISKGVDFTREDYVKCSFNKIYATVSSLRYTASLSPVHLIHILLKITFVYASV